MSEPDDGLSGLARAYQAAGPWLGAVWSLIGGTLMGGVVGYAVDHWARWKGPWGLLAGLVLGIVGGFIGFLSKVTQLSKKKNGEAKK